MRLINKDLKWIFKSNLCMGIAINLCMTYPASSLAAVNPGAESVASLSAITTLDGFLLDQTYELKKSAMVQVLRVQGDESKALLAGEYLSIPAGAMMSILDIQQDPQFGRVIRVGMDTDSSEEIPSDFWVKASDLIKADAQLKELSAFGEGQFDINADNFGAYDENSDDDYYEVEVAGKRKRAKKGTGGRKRKGMTYCYREVKQTLLKYKICKHYASGSMAFQGYKILQKECGMKPVAFSNKLPQGAVCVSSGGRSCGKQKCGHIAIKVSSNTWYGAGYRGTPWLSGRKPMGCLVAAGAAKGLAKGSEQTADIKDVSKEAAKAVSGQSKPVEFKKVKSSKKKLSKNENKKKNKKKFKKNSKTKKVKKILKKNSKSKKNKKLVKKKSNFNKKKSTRSSRK